MTDIKSGSPSNWSDSPWNTPRANVTNPRALRRNHGGDPM
jgi:hypothetical protein